MGKKTALFLTLALAGCTDNQPEVPMAKGRFVFEEVGQLYGYGVAIITDKNTGAEYLAACRIGLVQLESKK